MPDQEAISLSLKSIITLAFTTGIVSTVVTTFIGWWKEAKAESENRKRHATYLALRVAVLLEDFAMRCADVISDQDTYDQSGGSFGSRHRLIPDLPEYPKEDKWETLDAELLARVLTLPNEIRLAKGYLDFAWQLVDDEEASAVSIACNQQSGKCGYRAWLIAVDLRHNYSLPVFDPKQVSWDVPKTLKKKHDDAMEELRRNQEI